MVAHISNSLKHIFGEEVVTFINDSSAFDVGENYTSLSHISPASFAILARPSQRRCSSTGTSQDAVWSIAVRIVNVTPPLLSHDAGNELVSTADIWRSSPWIDCVLNTSSRAVDCEVPDALADHLPYRCRCTIPILYCFLRTGTKTHTYPPRAAALAASPVLYLPVLSCGGCIARSWDVAEATFQSLLHRACNEAPAALGTPTTAEPAQECLELVVLLVPPPAASEAHRAAPSVYRFPLPPLRAPIAATPAEVQGPTTAGPFGVMGMLRTGPSGVFRIRACSAAADAKRFWPITTGDRDCQHDCSNSRPPTVFPAFPWPGHRSSPVDRPACVTPPVAAWYVCPPDAIGTTDAAVELLRKRVRYSVRSGAQKATVEPCPLPMLPVLDAAGRAPLAGPSVHPLPMLPVLDAAGRAPLAGPSVHRSCEDVVDMTSLAQRIGEDVFDRFEWELNPKHSDVCASVASSGLPPAPTLGLPSAQHCVHGSVSHVDVVHTQPSAEDDILLLRLCTLDSNSTCLAEKSDATGVTVAWGLFRDAQPSGVPIALFPMPPPAELLALAPSSCGDAMAEADLGAEAHLEPQGDFVGLVPHPLLSCYGLAIALGPVVCLWSSCDVRVCMAGEEKVTAHPVLLLLFGFSVGDGLSKGHGSPPCSKEHVVFDESSYVVHHCASAFSVETQMPSGQPVRMDVREILLALTILLYTPMLQASDDSERTFEFPTGAFPYSDRLNLHFEGCSAPLTSPLPARCLVGTVAVREQSTICLSAADFCDGAASCDAVPDHDAAVLGGRTTASEPLQSLFEETLGDVLSSLGDAITSYCCVDEAAKDLQAALSTEFVSAWDNANGFDPATAVGNMSAVGTVTTFRLDAAIEKVVVTTADGPVCNGVGGTHAMPSAAAATNSNSFETEVSDGVLQDMISTAAGGLGGDVVVDVTESEWQRIFKLDYQGKPIWTEHALSRLPDATLTRKKSNVYLQLPLSLPRSVVHRFLSLARQSRRRNLGTACVPWLQQIANSLLLVTAADVPLRYNGHGASSVTASDAAQYGSGDCSNRWRCSSCVRLPQLLDQISVVVREQCRIQVVSRWGTQVESLQGGFLPYPGVGGPSVGAVLCRWVVGLLSKTVFPTLCFVSPHGGSVANSSDRCSSLLPSDDIDTYGRGGGPCQCGVVASTPDSSVVVVVYPSWPCCAQRTHVHGDSVPCEACPSDRVSCWCVDCAVRANGPTIQHHVRGDTCKRQARFDVVVAFRCCAPYAADGVVGAIEEAIARATSPVPSVVLLFSPMSLSNRHLGGYGRLMPSCLESVMINSESIMTTVAEQYGSIAQVAGGGEGAASRVGSATKRVVEVACAVAMS